MPERVSGPPLLMLPGAALGSLAARFCWQGQHFRPERVSGPPLLMRSFLLAGAALQALDGARARFGAPPLDALDGARARFGAPPLDAARRSTWEPRGSFLLAGAALQALDGARARFGAPPLDAGRGSTSGSGRCPSAFRGPPLDAARRSSWEPRGSFLLAGAALQALRARFGAPPLMLPDAALGSLAARFCWQGQHFRLWTVPERARCCQAQHLGASRLVSAGRDSTSGSGRYPSAFRGPP